MRKMGANLASQLDNCIIPELRNLLRSAGEIAQEQDQSLYLVGGAVRDMLLGRSNLDLDLVADGDATKLANLLAKREGGRVTTHSRFGTAKFRQHGLILDIATARAEVYSRPGALPTVRPGSMRDDLFRRDFTINAMAVHLDSANFGKLVDLFGGQSDLDNHLIRVLHEDSFIDDATRMLRGIRYEQRLGFQIEPGTENLLRRDLSMLDTISGDRIRHEFELILKEYHLRNIFQRSEELGVLAQVYPPLKANGWLYEKLEQARSTVRPIPAVIGFSLLAYRLDAAEADFYVKHFRFPKEIAHAVLDTIRLRENIAVLEAAWMLPSAVFEMLRGYSLAAIQTCGLASDNAQVSQHIDLYLDKLRHVKTLLDGEDLQRMGIVKGQSLGDILRDLHAARLDGKVKTREEEERLAADLISQYRTD